MMAIGDWEGRAFLSNPHTNYELFYLLTTKQHIFIGKHEQKGFKKILNSLKYDKVASF